MSSRLVIGHAVRALLCARGAAYLPQAADEMPLGSGGLGLDSIAMAEVLIECGRRFGVPVPAELLAEEPLTVGRLVDHLHRVVG